MADLAYGFNENYGSTYFYWKEDADAFKASSTASAFSGGQLALAGIGGLAVGILGTSLVTAMGKKKKNDEPEAPAAA